MREKLRLEGTTFSHRGGGACEAEKPELGLQELDVVACRQQHLGGGHPRAAGDELRQLAGLLADPPPAEPRRHALRRRAGARRRRYRRASGGARERTRKKGRGRRRVVQKEAKECFVEEEVIEEGKVGEGVGEEVAVERLAVRPRRRRRLGWWCLHGYPVSAEAHCHCRGEDEECLRRRRDQYFSMEEES